MRGIEIFLRKLLSHTRLSTADQTAIAELPHSYRHVEANEYILREGDQSGTCPVLVSGFAFRQKQTEDGGRQIVALKIPGDPLDFQSLFLSTVDHNLQALTSGALLVFANRDFERLVTHCPSIARGVVVDILIEASVGREWLLNIGRRDARARLAHLLCEIHYRLLETAHGLTDTDLPLTQEQLADLLGLTPVHINRTLKSLERDGAIVRCGRSIRVGNLAELCRGADFSETHLHRGQEN